MTWNTRLIAAREAELLAAAREAAAAHPKGVASSRAIAAILGCSPSTVRKWRLRLRASKRWAAAEGASPA